MKEWNIKITDKGDIYINDKICGFDCDMDKEDHEVDLDKKAILALADEMGYEAQFLFEEMAQRLEEMLDEIEDDDDNDFLQGLMDEAETEETIDIWLEQLLESTGKSNVDELTTEEILVEIDNIKGTIQNEEIVLGISEFAEKNIEQYEAYLEVLEKMLNNKEEN